MALVVASVAVLKCSKCRVPYGLDSPPHGQPYYDVRRCSYNTLFTHLSTPIRFPSPHRNNRAHGFDISLIGGTLLSHAGNQDGHELEVYIALVVGISYTGVPLPLCAEELWPSDESPE